MNIDEVHWTFSNNVTKEHAESMTLNFCDFKFLTICNFLCSFQWYAHENEVFYLCLLSTLGSPEIGFFHFCCVLDNTLWSTQDLLESILKLSTQYLLEYFSSYQYSLKYWYWSSVLTPCLQVILLVLSCFVSYSVHIRDTYMWLDTKGVFMTLFFDLDLCHGTPQSYFVESFFYKALNKC